MRAPTSQSTTTGAPIDPAIISSQLKTTQPKKNAPASGTDKTIPSRPEQPKGVSKQKAEKPQKPADAKSQDAGVSETKPDTKGSEKSTPLRSPAATGGSTPSATATVERDVLNSFKNFAAVQRSNAEKARLGKAKADKEVKLTELKFFANTFKLSTPVPNDLIGIIAKDPSRQKEIQARAMQNAEDVQKAKDAVKLKETQGKEAPAKPLADSQAPTPASDPKPQAAPRPQVAPHTSSQPNISNRHGGNRQSYAPSTYNGQQFPRGDRSGQQQSQGRPTGNLAQRLRNADHHNKAAQPPHVTGQGDARLPPTAPANGGDSSFSRRLGGAPGHMNKLNPSTQEFRPSAFAPAFNPAAQPSTTSSPKSAVANQGADAPSAAPVQVVRRKTKPVDCKKCDALSQAKTIKPPQGRSWDDNGGLRPTFDTAPTWRQMLDKEDSESTMQSTYKQYLERNPFAGPAGTGATPNPAPVLPHMAHQHQLPFHLQQGAQMAPRPSPHMPPMQMHGPPHSHSQHMGYTSTDDHRMVHSTSSQSFASPRISQAPVYPPSMNSPAQMPYGQPVMQPFSSNAPHMGQYRSFSNNPQYMPQQQGHMGAPMMMQPQYMGGPQGMLVTPPQMQMYPSSQGQFMPPGSVAVPPQGMAASNGYPSPGRPAAAPMAHQGSAQGQQAYGMSPSMAYQQPAYGGQPPGHSRCHPAS